MVPSGVDQDDCFDAIEVLLAHVVERHRIISREQKDGAIVVEFWSVEALVDGHVVRSQRLASHDGGLANLLLRVLDDQEIDW